LVTHLKLKGTKIFNDVIKNLLTIANDSEFNQDTTNLIDALHESMTSFFLNKYSQANLETVVDVLNRGLNPQLVLEGIIDVSLHEETLGLLVRVISERINEINRLKPQQIDRLNLSLLILREHLANNSVVDDAPINADDLNKIQTSLATTSLNNEKFTKGGIDLNPDMITINSFGKRSPINFRESTTITPLISGLYPILLDSKSNIDVGEILNIQ
jgi:hypothetical protein